MQAGGSWFFAVQEKRSSITGRNRDFLLVRKAIAWRVI
jgi:hypothetical protein